MSLLVRSGLSAAAVGRRSVAALAIAAARADIARAWRAKFLGLVPRPGTSRAPCVWLHAVSVGEVNLLAPLVAEWTRRHARLGVRDLDHHADRLRAGPTQVSRSARCFTARWISVGPCAGRCGAFGPTCWCWPSWNCGRI